mgnify:CR=1 FL=1
MIKEEKIKTDQGNGIYYSTEVDGKRYVSRIVVSDYCKTPEILEKWKIRAKKEITDLIDSIKK